MAGLIREVISYAEQENNRRKENNEYVRDYRNRNGWEKFLDWWNGGVDGEQPPNTDPFPDPRSPRWHPLWVSGTIRPRAAEAMAAGQHPHGRLPILSYSRIQSCAAGSVMPVSRESVSWVKPQRAPSGRIATVTLPSSSNTRSMARPRGSMMRTSSPLAAYSMNTAVPCGPEPRTGPRN